MIVCGSGVEACQYRIVGLFRTLMFRKDWWDGMVYMVILFETIDYVICKWRMGIEAGVCYITLILLIGWMTREQTIVYNC